MMRLTRTGIGLLTAQYRSVLKKCFLINAGLFLALVPNVASADTADDIGIRDYSITDQGSNLRVQSSNAGYKFSSLLGGNYIQAYYTVNAKEGETVTSYPFILYRLDGGENVIYLQNLETYGAYIWNENYWHSVDVGGEIKYYNSKLANAASQNNPVTLEIKNRIIADAQKRSVNGSLINYTDEYNAASVTRNGVNLVDNIAILDDVIGKWSDGKYIKAFDIYEYEGNASTGYKTSTLGANLQALDYALDNNYYRNIKVSRAEKLKMSPLAERSECIQGSTDFFKKFEDALTIAVQSRHDGLIFVANDNQATTTGNTTMYKKEA